MHKIKKHNNNKSIKKCFLKNTLISRITKFQSCIENSGLKTRNLLIRALSFMKQLFYNSTDEMYIYKHIKKYFIKYI